MIFYPPISNPAFTVRLLLSSSQNETLGLKPFSHFTLCCTIGDEQERIRQAFDNLKSHGPFTFIGQSALNFGTEEKPIWVIKLNISDELRALFSTLFDPIMCVEKNGVRYTWDPKQNDMPKCAHLTTGNEEIARRLVGTQFIFDRLDYKKLGPVVPHIIESFQTVRTSSSPIPTMTGDR